MDVIKDRRGTHPDYAGEFRPGLGKDGLQIGAILREGHLFGPCCGVCLDIVEPTIQEENIRLDGIETTARAKIRQDHPRIPAIGTRRNIQILVRPLKVLIRLARIGKFPTDEPFEGWSVLNRNAVTNDKQPG